MNEWNDEWSSDEQRELAALPRRLAPRPYLEERIVTHLKERGLLGRGRPHGRFPPFVIAASLFLLAAGFVLGRVSARPPVSDDAPRFALLLLRGIDHPSREAGEEAGRVAEYRDWARRLAASGRLVRGEKLMDRSILLGADAAGTRISPAPTGVPEDEIRGFFVISAANLEDALAVARACPHLRHGGRILVRPIAPT